jgi:hypothetical protein
MAQAGALGLTARAPGRGAARGQYACAPVRLAPHALPRTGGGHRLAPMLLSRSRPAFAGAIDEAAFQAALSLCAPQRRAGTGTRTSLPAAHP